MSLYLAKDLQTAGHEVSVRVEGYWWLTFEV